MSSSLIVFSVLHEAANKRSQLGDTLAQQERVKVLEPPVPLPTYKVKQHWHERHNADSGNIRLRQVMMALFAGKVSGSNP